MKVYFCNCYDEMREIGEVKEVGETPNDIFKAAMQVINPFLEERRYKSYYTRYWREERDGVPMMKFDVGSHSEFFYIDKLMPGM